MTEVILYEIRLLYMSLLLGAYLMFCYDILRVVRLIIRHGSLVTGLEDLFYWLYAGGMTFYLLYHLNDGRLRAYAIGGVLAGMLLYDRLFSRVLGKGLKKLKKYSKMKDTNKKSR